MTNSDRMVVTLTVADLRALVRGEVTQAVNDALGGGVVDKRSAAQLGISPSEFLDAAAAEEFPSFKLGRRRVAHRTAVIDWLERKSRVAWPTSSTRRAEGAGSVKGDALDAELADGALRVVRGGRR